MKQGLFLPGSGLAIQPPEFISTHPVDAVVVMNPVYLTEIGSHIQALGASATLVTPEAGPKNR